MSAGAGRGPAGIMRAGSVYETPIADDRGQLVSSRLINAQGQVVQTTDGTGAYEGMNDVAQCVMLKVSGVERPAKRTANYAREYEQAIRDELSELTSGQSPKCEIVSIDIQALGDLVTPRVTFKDLLDGGRIKTFTA